MNDEAVIIRVNSHRARAKMTQTLGYYPQALYSFRFSGSFYEVPVERLADLISIKSISRTRRKRDELLICWTEERPVLDLPADKTWADRENVRA